MPHRSRPASARPKSPAHALFLLVCTLLLAGCDNSPKPGETHGNVVAHVLDSASDDPHATFGTDPGGPAGPLPAGDTVNGKLSAQDFAGTPTVGALFLIAGGVPMLHFCTASVVRSTVGDLIATAAHCVYNSSGGGFLDHIMFVPGYHDDTAPYGMWIATKTYMDRDWIASENPDLDVAFLAVRPLKKGSGSLESVTGSGQFRSNPGYSTPVDVVAYPLGAQKAISCAATTTQQSPTQLRFDCDRFADGSSGAPFLTDDGAVVGVVGGYQQGGLTPDVSYSSYFGDRITQLYAAAVAGG